jgi:hypothetical protein
LSSIPGFCKYLDVAQVAFDQVPSNNIRLGVENRPFLYSVLTLEIDVKMGNKNALTGRHLLIPGWTVLGNFAVGFM